MSQKNTQQKSATISAIRAIAMSMIIACHILQGQNSSLALWLNLGVQIFFFMSGFLYGGKPDYYIKNKRKWYFKQFSKILIPYILLVVIVVIVNLLATNTNYTTSEILRTIFAVQGITGGGIPELSHTWFISYILLCYLITPFLFYLNIRGATNKRLLFGLCIAAVLFCLADYLHIFVFNMAWVFNYILGFYFARYYTSQDKNYKSLKIWLYALAIFSVIIKIALQHNIAPHFSPSTITIVNSWTHTIIGSAIFIALYDLFNKIKITYNKLIIFCDTYSYHIYLVHQVFILGAFSLVALIPYPLIGIPIVVIAAIIAGANLYYLSWFAQHHAKTLSRKIAAIATK